VFKARLAIGVMKEILCTHDDCLAQFGFGGHDKQPGIPGGHLARGRAQRADGLIAQYGRGSWKAGPLHPLRARARQDVRAASVRQDFLFFIEIQMQGELPC